MTGRAPDKPAHTQTLFVPYVVCASHGGRLDDAAFDAGVVCGMVYEELAQCERIGASPRPRWLARALVPQVDLFAMRFGYTLRPDPDTHGGWVRVSFARPGEEAR